MRTRILALTLLLSAAGSGKAWALMEIEDDTIVFGLDAGIGNPFGGASKAMGPAGILGGQFLFHPTGERGVGLQVERFDFKRKNGGKVNMNAIMAAARFNNILGGTNLYLPYVLIALGYGESRADLPGNSDRGSGFAWRLGGGVDYMLSKSFSVATEARLDRIMAPLPLMGLSGATVLSLVLRLNLWFGPSADPFRSGERRR